MLADGRLGVVDYGAVARLPDGGLPPVIGRLLRSAVDEDWPRVLDGLRAEGFVKPGVDLDVDVLRDYLAPFVEPASGPTFAFNRAWMREQAERIANPRKEAFATATRINMPPSYLLIHRVWMGGIGVLCQLGAEADFRTLVEESLPGFSD